MEVLASAPFTASAEGFDTGLAGTIGMTIIDEDSAIVVARVTAGITEETINAEVFYVGTAFTSPASDGHYFLDWDDGAGNHAYEDLNVVAFGTLTLTGDSYATVDELFRILKIRNPSEDQTTAGERVLISAALEIDREIDLQDDQTALTDQELNLITEVNLERAVELWRLQETAFGIVGLGAEFGATHIARNTWDKYAFTLAPLKRSWGFS